MMKLKELQKKMKDSNSVEYLKGITDMAKFISDNTTDKCMICASVDVRVLSAKLQSKKIESMLYLCNNGAMSIDDTMDIPSNKDHEKIRIGDVLIRLQEGSINLNQATHIVKNILGGGICE